MKEREMHFKSVSTIETLSKMKQIKSITLSEQYIFFIVLKAFWILIFLLFTQLYSLNSYYTLKITFVMHQHN